MYVIVWEYAVKAGREIEFERIYGPDGAWAALFKQAGGYLGTDLLRATGDRRVYRTVDRWASDAAYDDFMKKRPAEYAALDRVCEGLMDWENRVGAFTCIK